MTDQLVLFTITPEPIQEGFKCIYCGFSSYLAVFADHSAYVANNPDWETHVASEIARQTTRPVLHVYIHDKKKNTKGIQ